MKMRSKKVEFVCAKQYLNIMDIYLYRFSTERSDVMNQQKHCTDVARLDYQKILIRECNRPSEEYHLNS